MAAVRSAFSHESILETISKEYFGHCVFISAAPPITFPDHFF
jgi:hypothetical protein